MPDAPAPSGNDPSATAERRRWMSVLARAATADIAAVLDADADLPGWRVLRGPETGLVMLRGRAGGGGAPFNLGETTVTRCSVRTESGHVGHAYVLGRDARHAELAALADALLQDDARRPALTRALIAPLATAQAARRTAIAEKAAATKVEFFTMRSMRT